MPELDPVGALERLLAADGLAVHAGPVRGVQVADVPVALGESDLSVVATGQVVGEDDAVLGGPADPKRHPALERVDVAEPVVEFGHEVGGGRCGHADPGGGWSVRRGEPCQDTRSTRLRATAGDGNGVSRSPAESRVNYFRKPSWRSQSAQDCVHLEHGRSLGRTPKSWAAVA